PATSYWLQDIHLPPLLRHARGSEERFFTCNRKDALSSGEIVSRNISERLARRFPAGSSAHELQSSLIEQGFKSFDKPCPDPSIHEMWFEEKDHLVSLHARVHWQSDTAGRIVWTKATIFFIS